MLCYSAEYVPRGIPKSSWTRLRIIFVVDPLHAAPESRKTPIPSLLKCMPILFPATNHQSISFIQ
jgi:hypothetical protein